MEVDSGAEQVNGCSNVDGNNSGNHQSMADRGINVVTPTAKHSAVQAEIGWKKASNKKKKSQKVSNLPPFQVSEEALAVTEEALSLLENSAQMQMTDTKDTNKELLTGPDYVFIEKAVMKYEKVDPWALLPGITSLLTATLKKKKIYTAKKVVAEGMKSTWRKTPQSEKLFWNSEKAREPKKYSESRADIPYPPYYPNREDQIPMAWWLKSWLMIDLITNEFLERKEVSRNLKF